MRSKLEMSVNAVTIFNRSFLCATLSTYCWYNIGFLFSLQKAQPENQQKRRRKEVEDKGLIKRLLQTA